MAASRVAQALHLKQANLIEATSKDVDDVSVVGCAFGQILVELCALLGRGYVQR